MHWRKIGLIFRPNSSVDWMHSHAQLPVPVQLHGSVYRVFFSSRTAAQRSCVGYVDIDLAAPQKPLAVSSEPILKPGGIGCFDGDGVYVASVVRERDRWRLYTIGWNSGDRAPLFYASIGLAYSSDQGVTAQRHGRAPIMARSEHDPCLVTSPMVLRDNGLWRMWYVSGYEWFETPKGLHSKYHIKYADSDDGVTWRREGLVCLDGATPEETNISRFWVMREGATYHAWYAYYRGSGYRIGHATSPDGLHWTRYDENAGISLGDGGWDSEAISYPAVVRHDGRLFMFYNGNGFGREGFGLAIADP